MHIRTRVKLMRRVLVTVAVVAAVAWVPQIWFQAEFQPFRGLHVGLGGGALKLCIDGNGSVMSVFPASEHINGMEPWLAHRSSKWTWWFNASVTPQWWLYMYTIPMWFPLALSLLLAWYVHGQERVLDGISHQRCVNCGQDRRKIAQHVPCPGCGAKRVQAWAA